VFEKVNLDIGLNLSQLFLVFIYLPLNNQVTIQRMQEILGSYAQSQFFSDVYKILTQGVNKYLFSGNIVLF